MKTLYASYRAQGGYTLAAEVFHGQRTPESLPRLGGEDRHGD